jgi:cytochrome c oxidase cbb3-type subunit III
MASEKNPFPNENNTGHVWDDNLRELKNPPPRWWMLAFWASIIWWVAYGIIYPMWPLATDATAGITGWSSIGEYKESLKEIEAIRKPHEDKIKQKTAKQILADKDLSKYVVASGKVLYGDNCAACHGSGGQGGPDYPILVDDDWLTAGTIESIEQTITAGRKGIMNAHGKILKPDEVMTLSQYVIDLSNGKKNEQGAKLFKEKACIACHGLDGKGMAALGSANLTDKIWRFGTGSLDDIKYTIEHGVNDPSDKKTRVAEMPKFSDRLTKDEIKKLAVYVHKFGGGK